MNDRTETKTFSSRLNQFLSSKSRLILIVSIVLVSSIVIAVVAFSVIDNRTIASTELVESIQGQFDEWQTVADQTDESQPIETRLREAIDELTDRYPQSYGAVRGQFILANLEWELGNYEESRAAYLAVAESAPDGYLAAPALYSAGACSEELDDPAEATILYLSILDLESVNSEKARALMSLGRLAEQAGNRSEALEYYTRLIDEHGDSNWTNLGRSRIIWLKSQEGNSGS